MCFNQPMTLVFSSFGLFVSIYLYYKTKLIKLSIGVFYFFLMEFLQFIQYFYIDKCDSNINKFLTFLGFLHICFQPFFAHLSTQGAAFRNKKLQQKLDVVLSFCFVGGLLLLSRFFLSYIPGYSTHIEGFQMGYNKNGTLKGENIGCGRSTEWIRGQELCTFSARQHLGWSIPMADPTYFIPGAQLHFFLMFIPFLVLSFFYNQHKGKVVFIWQQFIAGLLLFLTGPVLAMYFTDDLMEQASIWCFFSIMQIFCLVLSAYDVIFYSKPKFQKEKGKKKRKE